MPPIPSTMYTEEMETEYHGWYGAEQQEVVASLRRVHVAFKMETLNPLHFFLCPSTFPFLLSKFTYISDPQSSQ